MVDGTTTPAIASSSGDLPAGAPAEDPSAPGRADAFPPKLRGLALRPGLVQRSRLVERLTNAEGALVVITAPPGFGKSTLLAQWAAADDRGFAFVSLDPSDNNPAELWNCVAASIRQLAPSFGSGFEPMPHPVGSNAIEALVRQLAAEMDRLNERVVVVLDDYHVIRNPACHASIEALTAHPISKAQLVVSTRADPPIPLGRLRASGELAELRGSELAFTRGETEEPAQRHDGPGHVRG